MTAHGGSAGRPWARHYLWELRPYFRQVAGELLLGSLAGIVMNTAVVLPALLLGRAIDAAFRAALRADARGQRRAVLTVAHRLVTARAADRVIVLDAGRVVEEGPPEELIRRGGRFAALVELEAAGWDWREA